jgi:hypothetical protein
LSRACPTGQLALILGKILEAKREAHTQISVYARRIITKGGATIRKLQEHDGPPEHRRAVAHIPAGDTAQAR